MIRVGVTGGIGSGKSLICNTLQKLGIPVFYADEEVKKMYNDTDEVRTSVADIFGKEVYVSGKLDRKKLAQKVFGNDSALAQLNAIAHPAVAKRFLAWAGQQKNTPYVVQEAALIFESHANQFLDKVVNVNSPENLRIQRVMQRDGSTPDEVKQRMAHQLSDAERSALSDFTIVNDNATPLLPQILKTHERLCAIAEQRS